MMRIAIEAVGNRSGGGLAVLSRVARALASNERVERMFVFCSPVDRWSEEPPELDKGVWIWVQDKLHRRIPWYESGFDAMARDVGADVALCMNAMGTTRLGHVNVVQQALAVTDHSKGVKRSHALKLGVQRRMMARSCSEARTVVAQTPWMRTRLIERFGSRRNVEVLPLGLIPHEGGSPDRGPVVTCVTSSLGYKNRRVADEMARIVKTRQPNAEYVVFEADSAPRPFEAVRDVLRRAQVSVSPSLVESMPLPIAESMAFDCAVIAADRPYARDVADNAALYFDPTSPAEGAARLEEVLSEPALREDLVGRGRERLATLWTPNPYEVLVDLLEDAT